MDRNNRSQILMARFRFLIVLLLLSSPLAAQAGLRETDEPMDAPHLELRDEDGKVHRLESYRGRVLVVNFWASWCTPCVRELPSLRGEGALVNLQHEVS